ncbi:MAG: HAMP domain-containing histidine kinase [Oscillospiraceae bacterium]|jgi:signal transduction histidine kinase|nr:HAMP domain-containing histidine kinase [Oscillospiraceae bacterium]
MKQKTTLMTLGLFLVFFSAAVLLASVTMLRGILRTQRERCLGEHYLIASSLLRDIRALNARGIEMSPYIDDLMLPYLYFSQDGLTDLLFYQEGQLIYSSSDRMAEIPFDLSAPPQGDRLTAVRDSRFLWVAGWLPEPYQDSVLAYRFDLRDELAGWRRTRNFLLVASTVFSALFTGCLYLLMSCLFRPMERVAVAAQSIAAGNFGERLPVAGRDELTELSRSFNQMAEEIQRQMASLQESARQKQQLIDNLSHEMRTPLTTIYGYAEYLQKAAISPEDRQSALGYILSECRRMQNMAGQLLELASLRGGDLEREPADAAALFDAVSGSARYKAIEKQVSVVFQRELETLTGDLEVLRLLLDNLIDNAIKACAPGEGRVLVRAFRDNGKDVLLVQDNGKGMTAEQLAHIREPFYRADKARSRRDGGAGLGLALCEQIVQAYQAEMSFSSQPGEGTTVRVAFERDPV